MSRFVINLRQRIVDSIKARINNKINSVKTKISDTFTLPEKYKGTIVEKWALYWKHLGIDYKDVFVGVLQQTKEKPIRAGLYGVTGYSAYKCIENNPSHLEFLEQLRYYNTDLVQVDQRCQKPESAEYITFLHRCYNENVVRYLNVGVMSFIWIDDYDKALGLYKSTCSYTQPEYLTFHKRIVDIGFWNKWWILTNKMKNYDVPI